jgi:1,4-dihydroxy-2-naphthoate octaprenyltransferase
METVRLFIRLSRPLFLLGVVMLYFLGVGIAKYLGVSIHWGLFWLGLAWVALLQLSAQFLFEYFNLDKDLGNTSKNPFAGRSGALGPGKLARSLALFAAISFLGVDASLSILLFRNYHPPASILIIMILAVVGIVFYSVPPVRLVYSGYGELLMTILVTILLPAFAFILQKGEIHRLLAMTTFPLSALHLSMMVGLEFPDYAGDLKYQRKSLLIRIGWQNAILLHNLLVLGAFLLLGLALVFGMPPKIGLPAFLTLPVGLLQIWQMRRIADGYKPNWLALSLNAVILYAATIYLLTFSYWIR